MKKLLLPLFIFSIATTSYALTVFGESSTDSKIDYSTANDAERSVVALGALSAVYLGNGWFITADHCNPIVGGSITQNGAKGYIDSVEKSINGADLTLFHVDDLSSFSSLKAAKLSTEIFAKLSSVSFSFFSEKPKNTNYSELLLVGNGRSGDGNVNLDSNGYATISSNSGYSLRSGTSPVVNQSQKITTNKYSQTEYIITASENSVGTACVQMGDSGGGMFFEYEGDWYLVGILGIVIGPTPSTSSTSSTFGELTKSNTKISQSDNNLVSNISLSGGVNLETYIDEIEAIIIPEPAETATIVSLFLIIAVAYFKRTKR